MNMHNDSFDVSSDNGNFDLNLHDKSLFTTLDINIWSGCKKLTPKDFGYNADLLPPGKLASLGTKKVFNPSYLDPFKRIRYDVGYFLAQYSLSFAKGFIYPLASADFINERLEEEKEKFIEKKRLFLNDYESNMEEWLQEADNAQWRHLISGSMVDVAYVANRFNFRWYTMSFNPAAKSGQLEEAVINLPTSVFADVVDSAKKLMLSAREEQKVQTNQKAIGPFERIMEKLNRMRFFNPKAATLARGIELVLNTLPVEGTIVGADFQRLLSLANSLSSMKGISSLVKKIEENPESLIETEESLAVSEEESVSVADESDGATGIVPIQEDVVSEDITGTGIVPVDSVASEELEVATEESVEDSVVDPEIVSVPEENSAPAESLEQEIISESVPATGIIPLASESVEVVPVQQLERVAEEIPNGQASSVEDVSSIDESALAGMFNLKVDTSIPKARSFRRPTTALAEV